VAATGSFGNPHVPGLPGQDEFTGRLQHVASYRSPDHYASERVVVGAGNSAVQVGYELAQVATVILATRHPVTFHPQRHGGHDLHYWLKTTGFDLLPPEWLRHYLGGRWVVDTGKYENAVATGQLDRRPVFTAFDRDRVIWPDGTRRTCRGRLLRRLHRRRPVPRRVPRRARRRRDHGRVGHLHSRGSPGMHSAIIRAIKPATA
jgi:putative flavoprotein involved in K+ transport